MATTSEIKAGLDDIAAEIRTERQALRSAQARVNASLAALQGLPTKYAGLIAEIDGFDAQTSDVFERLAKAEKAKLVTEFTALRGKTNAANTALQAIDFTT